jgi:hypothetical protein
MEYLTSKFKLRNNYRAGKVNEPSFVFHKSVNNVRFEYKGTVIVVTGDFKDNYIVLQCKFYSMA